MARLSVSDVLPVLKALYPDARCTLDFETPLELLVATILATQCTDARVNLTTPKLFRKYQTPQDYLDVDIEELEADIRSCGTYHMKAKAIRETMRTILDHFHGEVPRTMKDMLMLRGVGRKIAAVVLGTAFDITEGIPVDTHVTRVGRRLGLTTSKHQAKIERKLMEETPREEWLNLSHLLVAHGRAICNAQRPKCERCPFRDRCPTSLTTRSGRKRFALEREARKRRA